ncbi:MAG TPA: hypothetical protein VMX74_09070 [Pirellulales bacterium]|nr:hypothetical protein [Pirellulales bacterium]
MADVTETCVGDIDQDCAELLLESVMETHEGALLEQDANAESAQSLVRHAAAKKFSEVDPLESAAAEVVLKKKV